MSTFEQGGLFPLPEPQKSRLQEFVEEKYPVITALAIPYGKFDGFDAPYVRLTCREGSKILSPGRNQTSKWNATEEIKWDAGRDDRGLSFEGFVLAITHIRETSRPIAHVLHHITDVHVSSSAIYLDDIVRAEVWPYNAGRVKAMQQNAEVDGSLLKWDEEMGGWIQQLSRAAIDAHMEFWPEPTVVYESDGSG